MVIKKEPFIPYRLDEEKVKDKRETFTISVNREELLNLAQDQNLLQQSKRSTAYKQVYEIGRIVLHGESTGKVLRLILSNSRRNKKTGVADFD